MFWCHSCQKPIQSLNSLKCEFCQCEAIEEITQENHPQNYHPYQHQSNVQYQQNQNANLHYDNFFSSIDLMSPFSMMNSFMINRNNINQRNMPMGHSIFRMVIMMDPQQTQEKKKIISQQKIQELQKIWLTEDCAICQQNDGQGIKLPCKHQFHDNCIRPWFKQANTCPCCRKQL